MSIVFIDIEVNEKNKVVDYGAYIPPNLRFHGNRENFRLFIKGNEYICGHNALMHDVKYLSEDLQIAKINKCIDTLPLSALLYPKKPYHKLVKDYKMDRDINNDPFVDASLTHTLFTEEIEKFKQLPEFLKQIYYTLLFTSSSFSAFFKYIKYYAPFVRLIPIIRKYFLGKICDNAPLSTLIKDYPEELAYCIAIIYEGDLTSVAPEWVIHKYKHYHYVMDTLRGVSCHRCDYCKNYMESTLALSKYFNFTNFRSFNNVNLQEQVVNAQLKGDSIIAIFPTAGGKSLCFQLPALMMGEAVKGLTIVISPLQSLMNDQIENLKLQSINNVGTINGSQNILDRMETIKRVREGEIHVLYLAPESLRSPSIFDLIKSRNLIRFVIDEAHCFSTWGHDFRVDYQYIAEFIQMVLANSAHQKKIPIACFTATAKKEVVEDIQAYFKENLNVDMSVFKTDVRRVNLNYFVKHAKGHQQKMSEIKKILDESSDSSIIIYTARRNAAEKIAEELSSYGYNATVYHGGMKIDTKNTNQLDFTRGDKNIIVATSAFGMGVDKKDVSYVIHYQISPTIEDYLQEAGRAGRDEAIQAKCIVLYDEDDIALHFNLLTQTKLSHTDINTMWRTIKKETKKLRQISISQNELARRSGWEDEGNPLDTKVTNSILALEKVNYVKRHQNAPRVFASSLLPKTMVEASHLIESIEGIDDNDRMNLHRIVTALFTDKTTSPQRGSKPITMIDELYDRLDIEKRDLFRLVNILRDYKIIDKDNDLTAHAPENTDSKKSLRILYDSIKLLNLLINELTTESTSYNLKELNTKYEIEVSSSSVKNLRIMINFLDGLKIIQQHKDKYSQHYHFIKLLIANKEALDLIDMLSETSDFIIEYAFHLIEQNESSKSAMFSLIDLKYEFNERNIILDRKVSLPDIEKSLLLIHRIGALIIDGGFLVIYNPMRIEKKEVNPQKQYTQQDYKMFEEYYNQKIRKIHILTHFIKHMDEDTEKGMLLVDDYFNLNQKDFEKKYISKEYRGYFDKPMTSKHYDRLFGSLSHIQKEIIDDHSDRNIVVLAGPGSGKTTLLVHKLASLIELEDVKLTELLMLTFSRSATIVFKEKLRGLIGARANYVSIKTFHSFCFDLIGQVGSIDKTNDLFDRAIHKIKENDVDEMIMNITTLVIDEAQDMSEKEYELIKAIIEHNEKLHLIAVGDDDQNIYEFRGSDSKYFVELSNEDCNKYELLTNYRSKANLVDFSQQFTSFISKRYKEGFVESYTDENGIIEIVKYDSEDFYEPIIKQIKELNHKKSIGLLTYTNEDAEILTSLLIKEGIHARLIQSNKAFNLDALYEFDWFIKLFDNNVPVITEEAWKVNIYKFKQTYESLSIYTHMLEILKGYEILYPDKKFLTDLIEHISQSRLDDLYLQDKKHVIVSTIHKSKGREFDTVILMLNRFINEDKEYRAVYVALTRAKEKLFIHTNKNSFDQIESSQLTKWTDINAYQKPDELIIQLEHEDIYLSASRYCVNPVKQVSTDDTLDVEADCCKYNDKTVLYFSKAMKAVIIEKEEMGFKPVFAKVTYKVRWYDRENDRDFWLLLPKIYFKKIPKEDIVDDENNETENADFDLNKSNSESTTL